jgi:hypothetical protein
MSQRAESISLEQVTEAAISGVLRALDARKITDERRPIPGPILCGIIWWPERIEGEIPFVSKEIEGR